MLIIFIECWSTCSRPVWMRKRAEALSLEPEAKWHPGLFRELSFALERKAGRSHSDGYMLLDRWNNSAVTSEAKKNFSMQASSAIGKAFLFDAHTERTRVSQKIAPKSPTAANEGKDAKRTKMVQFNKFARNLISSKK